MKVYNKYTEKSSYFSNTRESEMFIERNNILQDKIGGDNPEVLHKVDWSCNINVTYVTAICDRHCTPKLEFL